MRTETPELFFSYARADAEFALKLATDLRSAGVDLWMDQLDIRPGERWDHAVEGALKSSPCLLVILSPASVGSHNVMDEVSFALEQGKRVLPVCYGECDIPFRLKRLQHVDFTADYDKALAALLAALNAYTSEASPAAARPSGEAPPAGAAPPSRAASGEARAGGLSGSKILFGSLGLAAVLGIALFVGLSAARDDGEGAKGDEGPSASAPAIESRPPQGPAAAAAPPPAPATESPREPIAEAKPLPTAEPAKAPGDAPDRAGGRDSDTGAAATTPDPLVVRDLNRHGYSLFRAGRFDEAISTLARAVSLQPDHPLANLNLAKAYCGAGRYKEAAATMEKAIRLTPRLSTVARDDGEFRRVCRPILGAVQTGR